ncbi:MAG: response regulator transcription factor [Nitrospirota bacterium]|nr:response regulator transcription factor [Nitrospirota bacterium]
MCAHYSPGLEEGLVKTISQDFTIVRMRSISGIEQALKASVNTAVFLDFDCPSREDLALVPRLKEKYPSVPVFLFTALTSEDLAVWAFRAGVRDYFVKPAAPELVTDKVRRCMGLLRNQGSECRPAAWQGQSVPVPIVASIGSDERKVQVACQYIEKFHHRKIKLDEVAGKVLLSPYQLCRLFRKTTGLAFKEYLVRYRLLRAEMLLAGTTVSITEIACAVGFSDSSNFQRLFRKKNGVSPREYRKNNVLSPLPQNGERIAPQRIVKGIS